MLVVTCVGTEYICAGEGVWRRPSESHHLSPECCSTWRWQGDLRAHHHWNCWGNSQVMCHRHSWLSLLLSNHSPALLSDRLFPTRWLITCSVSASEEPLRNLRLKWGCVLFWVSFQLQVMKDLIINICCCVMCWNLWQNMVDEGYAATQILSQLHESIIEKDLGDKQKSAITEKMAVRNWCI